MWEGDFGGVEVDGREGFVHSGGALGAFLMLVRFRSRMRIYVRVRDKGLFIPFRCRKICQAHASTPIINLPPRSKRMTRMKHQ